MTSSVAGWSTNRSMTAAPSAVSASRSRSPIDSRRRRNEPAGVRPTNPGVPSRVTSRPSTSSAARSRSIRDELVPMRAMPSRICASVLPERPRIVRRRPRLAAACEIVHRGDPELLVELADRLGPDARDLQDLDETRRDLGGELIVVGHVAGRGQLIDLVADGRPDAGQAGRLARAVRGDEVDRAAFDDVGRPVVGDGLEHEFALDLEHVADVVEDPPEIGVRQVGGVVGPSGASWIGARLRW